MKTETTAFSELNTAPEIEPRYVVALSFDDADTDITYITSHADCLLPAGVAAIDVINGLQDITGQTQKIDPRVAQHTIGNIALSVVDVNGELSTKINTKLTGGKGLRKKRVQLYKGHAGLTDWADYSLRFTYLVDGISSKDGLYKLACSDIQRTTKTRIFEAHQGVLSSDITATQMTIPVTIASADSKFPLLAHDALYDSHSSAVIGYIKIEDEVIAHSGWTDTNYNTLQVVERAALNTAAKAHTNPTGASSTEQNKKVEEYIYLQMPVPKMIYALLTGVLYGQGATLPDHWHLSVPTNYVTLNDFENIGADLWDPAANTGRIARFMGTKATEGKKFIEKELLLWLGAFMPVYSDGAYGLKRLNNVLPYSNYSAVLAEDSIIDYSDMTYDFKSLINVFIIKWNWIDNLGRYTKPTELIDTDSISKHGVSQVKQYEFQGVFTGVHSDVDIRNYINQIRDRYAAPPLRLKITVIPQWDVLEVGDTIRVKSRHIVDDNAGSTLDRVLEVQQVSTNWITGKVTLSLFGGVEPASQTALSSGYVMSDAFYTSAGTALNTVLTMTGNTVTDSGSLTGAADHNSAVYYHDGDLIISAGVVVTIDANVQLRVKGTIVTNGKIVGSENGYPGGSKINNISPTVGAVGQRGRHDGMALYQLNGGDVSVVMGGGLIYSPDYFPDYQKTITSLNIKNPDGLGITGIPGDLRGTSGSAGGSNTAFVLSGNLWVSQGLIGEGGDGGKSGAGLLVIARGFAFGGSGAIELHGQDGKPGSVGEFSSSTFHGAGGVGGSGGACILLIDGPASAPNKSFIKINQGAILPPSPSVNYLFDMPASNKRVGTVQDGESAAPNYDPVQYNQVDTNAYIGYLPKAASGYINYPKDEEREVTGYENKPPTWTEIVDDGAKPENGATVGATWGVNVTGSGLPQDNATVGATWGADIAAQPSDNDLLNVNTQWSHVAGTANAPEDNATAGATWGADIAAQPSDNDLLNVNTQWAHVAGTTNAPADNADVTAQNETHRQTQFFYQLISDGATPTKPATGAGSYNFSTGAVVAPTGWLTEPPDGAGTIWITSTTFTDQGSPGPDDGSNVYVTPYYQRINNADMQISASIIVTVGASGDFLSINDALNYLVGRVPVSTNVSAEIRLLSGFILSEQIAISGLNAGWITITGVDSETVIQKSAITTSIAAGNYPAVIDVRGGGTLPVVDQLFRLDDSGTNKVTGAIASGAGSSIEFKSGGITDVYGYTALLSEDGAIISAPSCEFKGKYLTAKILAYNGGRVNCRAVKSDKLQASNNSGIFAPGSTLGDSSTNLASGAVVTADRESEIDCGSSAINASGANAAYIITAGQCSSILIDDATLVVPTADTTYPLIRATGGGKINMKNSNLSSASTPRHAEVLDGGVIIANGVTANFVNAVNSISSAGIIFN